jgi:hypothetical protein
MITAFHFIASDNIDLKLDLDVKRANPRGEGLANYGMDKKVKYLSAKSRGVKWIADGKEYIIYTEGFKISGMVTPDLAKLVIVYPPEHPEFPSPNNAAIYNEDGSLYKTLTCPNPISELGKERKRHMNYESPLRLFFADAVWRNNEAGDLVQVINIGFDIEYFETRELNIVTGEFGNSLGSWRQ